MRLVVERSVDLPAAGVRRALADPERLLADLSHRLEPLPPEPGMARHWRVTANLGGAAREGRVWLPAPMPDDGCCAHARMEGVGAELALVATSDEAGGAILRVDLRLAAVGLRGHALMAMLRLAEPKLRARVDDGLGYLAGRLVAQAAV